MARSLALVDIDPPTPSMKRALAMETYTECRTLGHAWQYYVDDEKRPPQYGVRISLKCMRCPTKRHDTVKRMDGSVLGRGYDHPDDYSLTAAEQLSRDQWRRRYIKQTLGTGSSKPARNGKSKARRSA